MTFNHTAEHQMCICSHRRASHGYRHQSSTESGIGLGSCGMRWPDDPQHIQGRWTDCECRAFEEVP